MNTRMFVIIAGILLLGACTDMGHLYGPDATVVPVHLTYTDGGQGAIWWTDPAGEQFSGDYNTEDPGDLSNNALNVQVGTVTGTLADFGPGHTKNIEVIHITAVGSAGSLVRCVAFGNDMVTHPISASALPVVHGHGECLDQKGHKYELFF